jgi:leader peptidase (prepilin peptidase)/N-methyltransferase
MPLPLPLLMILAGLIGAAVGAVIDGVAVRWRPSTKVDAAMGAASPATSTAWWGWLPIVGWLLPLLGGERSKLLAMRAATEIIGALAFAALTWIDLDPLRLLLRAALIADLLLILRIDWQYHLIQDRAIVVGVVLALASAASQSTAALIGAALAGLVAALVFYAFYVLARVIYRQSALGFGDVLLAGLIGAALAGLVAALVFYAFYVLARVIYRQSALGFGDVLLAGLIGAAVGPAAAFGALFWGMVLASLGGLVISLSRRNLRTYFAYGAYLAVVAIGVLALPSAAQALPGFFQ